MDLNTWFDNFRSHTHITLYLDQLHRAILEPKTQSVKLGHFLVQQPVVLEFLTYPL